jgi:hypothetical protein
MWPPRHSVPDSTTIPLYIRIDTHHLLGSSIGVVKFWASQRNGIFRNLGNFLNFGKSTQQNFLKFWQVNTTDFSEIWACQHNGIFRNFGKSTQRTFPKFGHVNTTEFSEIFASQRNGIFRNFAKLMKIRK